MEHMITIPVNDILKIRSDAIEKVKYYIRLAKRSSITHYETSIARCDTKINLINDILTTRIK